MSDAETVRKSGLGAAIGTAGAGLAGPLTSVNCPKGKYVGTISVRLRTRSLAVPVQPGAVFVEVAIRPGRVTEAAASELNDALEESPADWASGSYISTGHGATWHPNLFIGPNDGAYSVVVRVWNRDNLDATRRITYDVAVTFSKTPVPGNESIVTDAWEARTLALTDPAAGADWSVATPEGVRRKYVGWRGVLTSSGVATRRMRTEKVMGGDPVWRLHCDLNHTDGLTVGYSQGGAVSSANGSTDVHWSFTPPGSVWRPGDIFRASTLSIQAADQWTDVTFDILEQVRPSIAAS